MRKRSTEKARPIACRNCDLNELCRLAVLMAHRDGRERPAVGTLRTVKRGAALFRSGDSATALFAVRQGMIKTAHLSEDGHERVIGFHAPGEVIGLEAFSSHVYRSEAIALEPSMCCELPLPEYGADSAQTPSLLTSIVRLLGEAAMPKLPIARGSARERVTNFLNDLAERLQRRGLNGQRFRLTMSRADIANFLDTRVETVSRTLQELHRQGTIYVKGSTIELLSDTAIEPRTALYV